MKSIKKLMIMLTIIMAGTIYNLPAQIYVHVRPVIPHYERVVAPSSRHVWIDEEWEPRGGSYVFVGGHWAEPPYERAVWVPGHWRHHERGEFWVAGHWRRR